MKVDLFRVSYFVRHGEDGPVLLQPAVNVVGPTQEEAVEFLKASFGDNFIIEVTGVANVASDVLIPDPGNPAPPPEVLLEIKALQDENVALKAKITEAHAELEKLHNPA